MLLGLVLFELVLVSWFFLGTFHRVSRRPPQREGGLPVVRFPGCVFLSFVVLCCVVLCCVVLCCVVLCCVVLCCAVLCCLVSRGDDGTEMIIKIRHNGRATNLKIDTPGL